MGEGLSRFMRYCLWAFGLAGVAGGAAGLGVLSVMIFMVFFGDDSKLTPQAIMARIQEETSIYTLDEKTQIGSFFNSEHRRYIPIAETPAHMINAIVASEDKGFYNHFGIDPLAIASAVVDGLSGGRFRGASTITQQTVKNILSDWEYSLRRKFREAIAAMQLERRYTKRQILEFYLNQFYVSGNGNGIGIAAKYYFNKDVRDLDLVESAFIAGSVKGPSAYDPFIKFTKEKREKAVEAAFVRKNYVLERMYEQGWINEDEFKEAYERPVRFNRGRFRTSEVALLQLVRGQLQRKEILQALNLESIRELDHAGLNIFTTIDSQLQEAAQLAMRRNLSRLETILSGFKPEPEDKFERLRDIIQHNYYYAKVEEILKDEKGRPSLKMDFGFPKGTIPYESLMRYAKWLDLSQWRGFEVQLKELMAGLKVGDVLFVEVKEYDRETNEAVLELHKRPRVNGGLIAIDKGEVRTVVSGFDTKGFNRAMSAKRQPGSVFKSVLYYAALQLGWTLLDQLDNERQVFPYQGRFYYPAPDHDTPYSSTSMMWAGVMSENLASVALAARLTEKLNLEQFKELMGFMGLLPEEGETVRDFHYRVARAVGVQLENEGVKEYQLQNAIQDLVPDLIFDGQQSILSDLKKMWWGKGYTAEMHTIFLDPEEDVGVKTRAVRLRLIKNNFQRFARLAREATADWTAIKEKVENESAEAAFADPQIRERLSRFRVLPSVGNKPELGYMREFPEEIAPEKAENVAAIMAELSFPGRPVNSLDAQAIWGANVFFGAAGVGLTDVKLAGNLPLGLFTQLSQYVDQRYENIMATDEKYDLTKYYQHHDFRIGLGLKFAVELTYAMGVQSKVDPILSFPLGTNDVTAAEVAKIYQTFISGKVYRYYKEGPANQLNFIRRIEDRFGNVLFEPQRQERQLADPMYSAPMREILRRVVTHGTGRTARGELHVGVGLPGKEKEIRIPAFGKTGTTNDYTNAYFAGFVPYPVEKNEPLNPDNSYVIASYVGYDFNRSMKRGPIIISGARGALPAWIGFAKAVFDTKKYGDFLDALDLNIISRGEWPLAYQENAVPIKIDLPRGVVLRRGDDFVEETYALTNIEETGETFQNEFMVGNLVKSVIRVPVGSDGGADRMFAPFTRFEEEVEGEEFAGAVPTNRRIESRKVEVRAKEGERLYDESGSRLEAREAEEEGRAPKISERQSLGSGARQEPGQVDALRDSDANEPKTRQRPGGSQGERDPNAAAGAGPAYDPQELFEDLPETDGGVRDGDDGAGFVEEELW